jgi:HKD family nuclease
LELLTNRQNDKIGDRLCVELRKAKSIFIAAAYFLPNDAVLNLMSKVPDLKIIVSEEFNINNPDKLKPLTNRGRVRCIPTFPPYTHGRLHAKVIWGTRDDSSEFAIVGSANLTTEGLFSNQEACIFFDSRSKGDAEVIDTVSTWLKNVWTDAARFDYKKAKAVFDNTRRHWKKKNRIYAQDSAIPNYWILKTTEGAGGSSYWHQFLEEGVIAIGWKELPINPAEVSHQQLISALESVYRNDTATQVSIAANTIRRFTYEVKSGDMVIISGGYPPKSNKDVYIYGIARVTGEFRERKGPGWRYVHDADIQVIERYFPKSLLVNSLGKKSQLKTIHKTDQAKFEKLCDALRGDYGIVVTG